eukprot:4524_1
MGWLFNGDDLFNGNISSWDTSKVTSLAGMFKHAVVFDRDISALEHLKGEGPIT